MLMEETMATATADTTTTDSGRPYMTEVIEGELVTLVLFIPSEGKFYEPLPEGHPDVDPDTALTLKDPRSGDTFDYEHGLSRHLQMVVGNHCVGKVSVDRWEDFRQAYVEADQTDVDRANEFLDEHVFEYEDGEGGASQ
jgi:hypothetical protein